MSSVLKCVRLPGNVATLFKCVTGTSRLAPGIQRSHASTDATGHDTSRTSSDITTQKGFLARKCSKEDHRLAVHVREDVYNGVDYLDFAFPFYMTAPGVQAYILEQEGRPICFNIWYNVGNSGNVVLQAAGRTSPTFAGAGIMKGFLMHSMAECKREETLPDDDRVLVFSFLTPANEERFSTARREEFKPILTRNFRNYGFKLGHVQHLAMTGDFQNVRMAGLNDLLKLFKDKASPPFCEEFVLSSWTPFQPTEAHARVLDQTALCLLSPGDSQLDDVTAVSFLATFCCQTGARYDLEFYGKDPEILQQHIFKALDLLANGQSFTNPDLDIQLVVYFPEDMDDVLLSEFARDMDWKQGALAHYGAKYMLAENFLFKNAERK